MNQSTIKQLETELWDAADDLRANSKLTAAEYKDPLLGLVLLRFAQNRYEDAKIEVHTNLPINPRTKEKREVRKEDYTAAGAIMLPEKAKYDYLAALPEVENIAEAINNAMKLIEAEYPDLEGILPKSYQEFDDKLLRALVRVFNKDAVKHAKGDVFGRIYEFFLMKFSMQGAGAQEGGEFFTPPSLVNLIVNFIEPNHGIIHDPACGSGGMFVQTAHFIKDHENKSVNEAITVYGTELKSNNTRLAKMNLAIHGIEGKIIEANSFYTNPHTPNLTGRCDFVMANPPFNVDKIDSNNKFLAEDERLPFGAPLTGKGTIGNGNYLWMQYFHAYLNETGRAGFVMASSATDAGNAEKLIRQKLIETGDVDCVVSIGNNFFYTRSLPCHVWFFDKGKKEINKDKVLMIDARNTFRVVTSTINDFSIGQQNNITTIKELYRKNENAFSSSIRFHKDNCTAEFSAIYSVYEQTYKEFSVIFESEKFGKQGLDSKLTYPTIALETINDFYKELKAPFKEIEQLIGSLKSSLLLIEEKGKKAKLKKQEITKQLAPVKNKITVLSKPLSVYASGVLESLKEGKQAIIDWEALVAYFPKGIYQDVEGLCKIASLEEIAAQDYSLTPGRYVGVKIDINMDFDYKWRMKEIHTELAQLNTEANSLMQQIQSVKL
ncbi:type I restriction-modification system subunit M [Polaribacter glomeratus]|uniref:site-specific DNA-methyltransferase (adenine-specific) n=1 Tax=Polaribacter glomeratus TaxID=102 RepID=A0A2S7WW27_9FLAO|nr:class I SAM-dependent DNA methyltransferase [Polaribacter glomeratus]PQJ81482.1 N-6 DNA methylase [Polaribacter glomeratus]TXD64690.1 SAM-dependent DNA methyltransferase [Polaribacter glomeratus]